MTETQIILAWLAVMALAGAYRFHDWCSLNATSGVKWERLDARWREEDANYDRARCLRVLDEAYACFRRIPAPVRGWYMDRARKVSP